MKIPYIKDLTGEVIGTAICMKPPDPGKWPDPHGLWEWQPVTPWFGSTSTMPDPLQNVRCAIKALTANNRYE